MRSPWSRQYARTPDVYIWGTEPSALAVEAAALVEAGGRVLDLGCGEGRDTVYFASRGLEATGLDSSRRALRKAARLATERGLTAGWVQGDLGRLPVHGRFNLVHSCGAIHYVPRPRRARLFRRMRAMTAPAGYHALAVFTDRKVYVELGEAIDYFAPGELAALYEGWRIMRHSEGLIACAQDGTVHEHSVEELVAQSV